MLGSQRMRALSSPLDELNKNIVKMLQRDGRIPFKEMAEALDVSEGTVRNRVNWMKQSGMLKIVAIADPSAFHYRSDAMLGVKVASGFSPKQVAARLSDLNEVVYSIWVSGRFDLLVEIVTDTEEEFLEFLENQFFDQKDVDGVEVMTCLSMFKNQFLLKRDME
ncbi:MAG: AsnC family transcriptional regulator [Alphaproteobacteria bacterium]